MKNLILLLFIVFGITTHAQIITTCAGGGSTYGDNVPATASLLSSDITDVAVDVKGNIYIADIYHQVIRKVNTAGTITTIAGTGIGGYTGDGGYINGTHEVEVVIVYKVNYSSGFIIKESFDYLFNDANPDKIFSISHEDWKE